jgi:hypothetical protein
MKKTILHALTILTFILPNLAQSESVQGMWPTNDSVIDSYLYYNQVTSSDIQGFIKESNYRLKAPQISLIAKNIIEAASCYEIDPVYLAGLIKKESMFKHKAKSSTGAAGLTQMTRSGINEIKDQLGVRGKKYARKSNTDYFESTTKKCLGNDWTSFKDTFYTQTYSNVKMVFYKNVKFSIYAGAMLLKVYLANATKSCKDCDLKAIYRLALEQYNGDTHKVIYASKIQDYTEVWMQP